MPSKVITVRIDSEEHERWKSHAREMGKAFNAWARSALEDQYRLESALVDDDEAKRAERRLVKQAMYPQPASLSKKTYRSDFK